MAEDYTYRTKEEYLIKLFKTKENNKEKKDNKILNKILETIIKNTPQKTKETPTITGPYDYIKKNTYAQSLAELQKNPGLNPTITYDGKKYVRPLTAYETIQTRLLDDKLFNKYLDTCTAIVYNGDGKLKIVPISKKLITLDKDFNKSRTYTDYDKTQAPEINYTNTKHKYRENLTEKEALNHEFYEALIPDKKVREAYIKKCFEKIGKNNKGMTIWTRDNPKKGETRALCLNNVNDDCYTNCLNDFNLNARFVRVAPKK